jgi:hypothetical protein
MPGIGAATIGRAACVLLVAFLCGCGTPLLSPPDKLDQTRLLNAIVADDAGYVRGAVSNGVVQVDQQIPAPAYMEGTPIITIAARAGSLNVLRYLISAGADVNARTPAGETSLMLAAYFDDGGAPSARHEEAVRLLIAAKASLENERHQYTALAYAAYKGHERIVRYLLERGARVNADAENGTIYVNTPLMMASIQGHQSTALMLLKAGADPMVRVVGGYTARELAAKYSHVSLARTLACAERAGGLLASARCE